MKVSCVLCDKQMDTKNEDVIVTVNWFYDELIKRNNIQPSTKASRIVKICKRCWDNTLKDKLQENDYFWSFNKAI